MNRHDESPEKQLQRNRDEIRRLENMRFCASIIFALLGFALVGAILYWARDAAISITIESPKP